MRSQSISPGCSLGLSRTASPGFAETHLSQRSCKSGNPSSTCLRIGQPSFDARIQAAIRPDLFHLELINVFFSLHIAQHRRLDKVGKRAVIPRGHFAEAVVNRLIQPKRDRLGQNGPPLPHMNTNTFFRIQKNTQTIKAGVDISALRQRLGVSAPPMGSFFSQRHRPLRLANSTQETLTT